MPSPNIRMVKLTTFEDLFSIYEWAKSAVIGEYKEFVSKSKGLQIWAVMVEVDGMPFVDIEIPEIEGGVKTTGPPLLAQIILDEYRLPRDCEGRIIVFANSDAANKYEQAKKLLSKVDDILAREEQKIAEFEASCKAKDASKFKPPVGKKYNS